MNPGKLNKQITLQQQRPSKDGEGISISVWVDLATIWASVEPIRGREYFQAAAVGAESTVRIRIRYREGITTDLRVLYGSRKFNIRSAIDPEERHRELHLMCEEVVNGG